MEGVRRSCGTHDDFLRLHIPTSGTVDVQEQLTVLLLLLVETTQGWGHIWVTGTLNGLL
jgi:hypothetical protein